jgi:hypothetical protein
MKWWLRCALRGGGYDRQRHLGKKYDKGKKKRKEKGVKRKKKGVKRGRIRLFSIPGRCRGH